MSVTLRGNLTKPPPPGSTGWYIHQYGPCLKHHQQYSSFPWRLNQSLHQVSPPRTGRNPEQSVPAWLYSYPNNSSACQLSSKGQGLQGVQGTVKSPLWGQLRNLPEDIAPLITFLTTEGLDKLETPGNFTQCGFSATTHPKTEARYFHILEISCSCSLWPESLCSTEKSSQLLPAPTSSPHSTNFPRVCSSLIMGLGPRMTVLVTSLSSSTPCCPVTLEAPVLSVEWIYKSVCLLLIRWQKSTVVLKATLVSIQPHQNCTHFCNHAQRHRMRTTYTSAGSANTTHPSTSRKEGRTPAVQSPWVLRFTM